MSTKKRPTRRIVFCPIEGRDEVTGKDRLGRGVEIGACWMTASAKGEIIRLTVVPDNLKAGVLFLKPVTQNDRGFA